MKKPEAPFLGSVLPRFHVAWGIKMSLGGSEMGCLGTAIWVVPEVGRSLYCDLVARPLPSRHT